MTKGYTVLYKSVSKFAGRKVDETLYTFTCGARDERDAVRQLKMARLYYTSNSKGREIRRFKHFKVVRVYTGDGVRYFTDYRGKTDRAVVVLKSRMPRWMGRNFFGKGK